MATARIAFDNRMWNAQDLSWNPYVAQQALSETSWTSLAYNLGARGKLPIYDKDNETKIDVDKLLEDAIALSLGIFTIEVPHVSSCNRLICNCKIM